MYACLITLSIYRFPVAKVNTTFRNNRRVGLGIGLRRHAYQLKIAYDSEEGFAVARKVMKLINETAHKYSEQLATEKGVSQIGK